MSQRDDAQDPTQEHEQAQDDAQQDDAEQDDRTQGGQGLTQPGPPSDPQNPTG